MATRTVIALSLGLVLATTGSAKDVKSIPAGAEFVVRTKEEIDTKKPSEEKIYSAVLERDVVNEAGATVVPGGSGIQLVVRKIDISRSGTAELAPVLQFITIQGTRYRVSKQL